MRTGMELEHEQLVKGVNKMRTGKKKKYYKLNVWN